MSGLFVKNLCLVVFCGIFISGKTHSLDCKDSWKGSSAAAQRADNEELLRSFQGEPDKLFFRNFKDGNMEGENSFIAIRGTSSIGRVLQKTDDYGILVETIDSSGQLKKMELKIEIGTGVGSDERPFVFIPNPPL